MKKIILSLLSLVVVGGAVAQSSITLEGSSTNISGTAYTHALSGTATDLHVIDFIVHNETGSTQQWKITRKNILNPPGWEETICWGLNGALGACYLHNASDPWSCGAEGILADSSGRLSTYISCSTGGVGQYRYYVSTDGINFVDSVDMIVTNTVSLEEKSALTISVAPNPASETLTVNTNGISPTTVRIVDVLGNVVLNEQVYVSKKTFDITRFRNGVYFVTVESEGTKPVTRKVIVRH